jgi:hypothetical protein
LAMQIPGAISTREANAGAKTQIHHPGAFAQGRVLGQGRTVIQDNLRVIQREKSGAELLVKFVERQLIHLRREIV